MNQKLIKIFCLVLAVIMVLGLVTSALLILLGG
jgi:energy-converting hydrogenase Eha subunit F